MSLPTAAIEASPGMLRVTEAYACAEGEGRTAGALTYLVRLSGCNLRCWWCDSKFSSFDESEATEQSWQSLLKAARQSGCAWISVTGGEPVFRGVEEMKSLAMFCEQARAEGLKVKIETNGLALPPALEGRVNLWSVSPKWDSRSEGERQRSRAMDYDEQVLDLFLDRVNANNLQLKFVICFDEAGQPLEKEWDRLKVLLSSLNSEKLGCVPIYIIPESFAGGENELREAYRRRVEALFKGITSLEMPALDIRVQAQHHKLLHGQTRGY